MAERMHLQSVPDEPRVPAFELRHRLGRALEEGHVSVERMAAMQRISRTTVSNWLHGRTRPQYSAIEVWASRCNVDLEWLAGDDFPPHDGDPAEHSPSTKWYCRDLAIAA